MHGRCGPSPAPGEKCRINPSTTSGRTSFTRGPAWTFIGAEEDDPITSVCIVAEFVGPIGWICTGPHLRSLEVITDTLDFAHSFRAAIGISKKSSGQDFVYKGARIDFYRRTAGDDLPNLPNDPLIARPQRRRLCPKFVWRRTRWRVLRARLGLTIACSSGRMPLYTAVTGKIEENLPSPSFFPLPSLHTPSPAQYPGSPVRTGSEEAGQTNPDPPTPTPPRSPRLPALYLCCP